MKNRYNTSVSQLRKSLPDNQRSKKSTPCRHADYELCLERRETRGRVCVGGDTADGDGSVFLRADSKAPASNQTGCSLGPESSSSFLICNAVV